MATGVVAFATQSARRSLRYIDVLGHGTGGYEMTQVQHVLPCGMRSRALLSQYKRPECR